MKWECCHRLKKRAFCTTTEVPRRVALRTHCGVQGRCVVSEERVGGRAGTAAPQGAVCELPNPLSFFFGGRVSVTANKEPINRAAQS